MAFPALNHAALTVRDLSVSGPWYRALIGADPVLDEHTDAGFRHLVWAFDNGTLFGIHQHDREFEGGQFTEFRAGLDHVGSAAPAAPSWRNGRPAQRPRDRPR